LNFPPAEPLPTDVLPEFFKARDQFLVQLKEMPLVELQKEVSSEEAESAEQ